MTKAKFLVVLWKVLLTGIALERTRTTRTAAFWGYPRRLTITHTIVSKFWILKQTWHETHLLNLLYTMCKYEMDPTSIVEDIERTGFCPQTDKRQGEKSIPLFNFVEAGGYDNNKHIKKSVCIALKYIYNLSLSSGVFPHELNIANVVPFHKASSDMVLSNYRHVSVLPVFPQAIGMTSL